MEYWPEGLKLIVGVLVLILVPCIGVAWVGTKLITELGRYPSQTARIQLNILPMLVVLEIVSFLLWVAGFRMLLD